jgi:hypothetical protein
MVGCQLHATQIFSTQLLITNIRKGKKEKKKAIYINNKNNA